MVTPLERGQTTLLSSLAHQRPPPGPRRGPKDKLKGQPRSQSKLPNSCLPRSQEQTRYVGGDNEKVVREMFSQFRAQHDDPDDPTEDMDLDIEERLLGEYRPQKRHSYPREYKLAAVEYFQTTWIRVAGGKKERITVRRAAWRLKIDRKSLRRWVANKQKIVAQPKGSRRARKAHNTNGRYHELEVKLYQEFMEARELGRKIDDKWLLRHAKAIFRTMYPHRVLRTDKGAYKYLDFRFSDGWFAAFKRRFNISLRAGTKRAQKSPDELAPTIVNFLQFNRRNTAVLEGSDCGIDRGPDVKVVGRFKLSNICNMDQSPLSFENCKGMTYDTRGSKTVRLKAQRKGWENRMCTLQLTVFADGILRAKALLIFRGSPNLKDKHRIAEVKQYHPDVIVVWNQKAYSNTQEVLWWIKHQYASAHDYPLSDREPRFLCLDAFSPHVAKGAKIPTIESNEAKVKRLAEQEGNR